MRIFLLCVFLVIAIAAMFGYAYCQDAPLPAVGDMVSQITGEEPFLALRPHAFTAVIDAGHGGLDAGATSAAGTAESGLNLDIALKTEALLLLCGLNPVLTRREDISLHDPSARTVAAKKRSDLQNRVALINSTPNAILISIHQNKFSQTQYYGAQCFYNSLEASKVLGELMQENLRRFLDPQNTREAKQMDGNVYLLKHSKVPSVLVECGFLSNPLEEILLQSHDYRLNIAMAITKGTLAYGG